jgi:hypothetical protein
VTPMLRRLVAPCLVVCLLIAASLGRAAPLASADSSNAWSCDGSLGVRLRMPVILVHGYTDWLCCIGGASCGAVRVAG